MGASSIAEAGACQSARSIPSLYAIMQFTVLLQALVIPIFASLMLMGIMPIFGRRQTNTIHIGLDSVEGAVRATGKSTLSIHHDMFSKTDSFFHTKSPTNDESAENEGATETVAGGERLQDGNDNTEDAKKKTA